jgi:hypothetical protein
MSTPTESQREPYVYVCEEHNFRLETRAPRMAGSLRIFCPLCKDEFFAKHLTELQNVNPDAGKIRKP